MPICVGIGEACGAAAVAVKKRMKLRDVDALISVILSALRAKSWVGNSHTAFIHAGFGVLNFCLAVKMVKSEHEAQGCILKNAQNWAFHSVQFHLAQAG